MQKLSLKGNDDVTKGVITRGIELMRTVSVSAILPAALPSKFTSRASLLAEPASHPRPPFQLHAASQSTTKSHTPPISPRPPQRRIRRNRRPIRRRGLVRPILSPTTRPPLAHTVIARELIARHHLIHRITTPGIRSLVQIARISILPPPHRRLIIPRIRSLTGTHAAIINALEGGGAIVKGEGVGGVEVDDGGAGAVDVLVAEVLVGGVGGGLGAGGLGGEVAGVGGRFGVARGYLRDLAFAGEVGGGGVGGATAGEGCGEGDG